MFIYRGYILMGEKMETTKIDWGLACASGNIFWPPKHTGEWKSEFSLHTGSLVLHETPKTHKYPGAKPSASQCTSKFFAIMGLTNLTNPRHR